MTPWTPRPPRPDEPACWSWPLPTVLTREQEIERLLAAVDYSKPPGERFERADIEMMTSCWDSYLLTHWHEGRCAACGDTGVHLVEDHDHNTGMVRGELCRGDNVAEGSRSPGNTRITRYRLLHPAKILGVYAAYTGRDWWHGYWGRDIRLAEFGDLPVPRPATPWPAINLDAALAVGRAGR